jgi:hypothetical protein
VISMNSCGFIVHTMCYGLVELSASDCKRPVCRLCKKALCCDLTRGRRILRGVKSPFLFRVGFLGSVLVED